MSIGIKETKEALIGVNELALFICERVKDGMGLDDIIAIWEKLGNDSEFKQKLLDAVNGIKAVPSEVKDIDVFEGVELANLQISYIPKYVETFKK